MKRFNTNIIYDTNSHEAIIEFIRKNIITDPEEFIDSLDEINRVAAKKENIKLYRFIQDIEEDEDNIEIDDIITELKTALRDNIIRELEFYDILSCHGQL